MLSLALNQRLRGWELQLSRSTVCSMQSVGIKPEYTGCHVINEILSSEGRGDATLARMLNSNIQP